MSEEQKAEARRLRSEGMTLVFIGEKLGFSHGTIRRVCSDETAEQERAKARARREDPEYRAKARARSKAWREANRERAKAGVRACYEANRERYLETAKRKRLDPEFRAKGNASNRAWRAANPAKAEAIVKAWREANRERYLATVKARYERDIERNRELKAAARRKRRATQARAHNDGHTDDQLQTHVAKWEGRCAYCLGSTSGRLEVDHVIPLSKGGAHTLSNLVPACQPCNRKKWASVRRPYIPGEAF